MRNLNTVIRSALLGFAIQGIGLSGWFFCNIMDLRTSGSFLGAVFMWPGHLTHRGGFQSVTISLSHALLFAFFAYIIQLWSNERISRVLDSIFLRSSIYGFSVLFVLVLCDFIFASGMPALSYFHPILILGYCTGLPIVMAISVFCEGVILSFLFARRISHMTRAGAIISTPATAQPRVIGGCERSLNNMNTEGEYAQSKYLSLHRWASGILVAMVAAFYVVNFGVNIDRTIRAFATFILPLVLIWYSDHLARWAISVSGGWLNARNANAALRIAGWLTLLILLGKRAKYVYFIL